jgi:hypothetical protein
MRHHNSVLHELLKQVPWSVFEKLVDEHGADARVRTLSTKTQFVSLLYAQLSGAVSLREIETAMASHAAGLYHLGVREVSRSTLADANAQRPHQVFTGLFAAMAGCAGRGFRRSTGEAVRLIDATGVRLAGLAAEWARFSKGVCGRAGVCGGKAHLIYDPDAERPLYLSVTPANVNDITAAKAMPVEPGATYVFDLGYYDYGWWAKLDAAGCRIVTRLKKNTPLTAVTELALPPGSGLLYDRIGHLPERLSSTSSNPFSDPVLRPRARDRRGDRGRRDAAHRQQRPRRARRGDRRPLQAALGGRAVLPVGQADPQAEALRRALRERRAHPDRRRPHRLSAAPPRPAGREDHRQPARLRPARPRQHPAQAKARSTPQPATDTHPRPKTARPQLEHSMNRTAVAQGRE